MKFKEKFQAILVALGFVDKAKKSELTDEDWVQIEASYNETHKSDFYADMTANAEQVKKAAQHDAALLLLAGTKGNAEEEEEEEGAEEGANASSVNPVDLTAAVAGIQAKIIELEKASVEKDKTIATLSGKLEEDNPKTTTMKVEGFARAHTDAHAFGIAHDLFATEKRWNKIVVNPNFAKLNGPSEGDERSFQKEATAFGASLAARYAHLKSNNLLNPERLMAATSVDYADVTATFGAQYVIRRQDALIAQILTIKTVYDFFPRRYGVQDMDTIFNVMFGEVSQGWQKGKIFKGSVEIQPELGHVDDVSIKLQFEPLKDIERSYLGYLNTEGSDAVKWGMIEWFMLGLFQKAVQEQTKRRVLGCAVKPETGVAGLAINASTGLIFTLIRYMHQYKLNPFADVAYDDYDSTTMLDTVNAFLAAWILKKGDQNKDEFTLVLNAEHQPWWIKCVRASYGLQTDFAGVNVNVVPDYNIPIYWCAGMENRQFIILTKPGNLQALENLPGEMMNVTMQPDFEDVLIRSNLKEGFAAAFVGKKFATPAALAANDYYLQQIFMNKPSLKIADDSVTLNGATNFWFTTQNNTTAGKKITDITNAKAGQVYIIECGGVTQPQTIDKALKFANLTAAWTPTAVGDYLMVILNNAGDAYRELERCVAGVRSVNALVQPTLPEARS